MICEQVKSKLTCKKLQLIKFEDFFLAVTLQKNVELPSQTEVPLFPASTHQEKEQVDKHFNNFRS